MAQRSWMFDSEGQSLDIVDSEVVVTPGDRVNASADVARYTQSLVTDGFVPGHGGELVVNATSPESGSVQVEVGRYFIQGRWYEVHTEPLVVDVLGSEPADPNNPRIDRIVVRRDLAARQVVAGVVHGTPGADPEPPALTRQTTGVWEDPLFQVFVRANATTIRQSDQGDGQGYVSVDERVPSLSRGQRSVMVDGLEENTAGFDVPILMPGRFWRARLVMSGRLSETARVQLRVNDDATTGLHRFVHLLRGSANNGAGLESLHADGTIWVVGTWAAVEANFVEATFLNIDGDRRVSGHATAGRNSTSPNVGTVQDSRFWLVQPRLLGSLRVGLSTGQFTSVRWWLEGDLIG